MSNPQQDWTVLTMLEWATDYFKQKFVPNPRHSIEWLLAEVLNIKRLDLYLKYDRPLASDELSALRSLVKRRARHEPLQYITGSTDFMNARIAVNKHVLIPRIETEQLVELVLDASPPNSQPSLSVLDIGTGSGCIPIALKQARPNWQLTGIDISENALAVARQNAEANNVSIRFQRGDVLKPLAFDEAFDLIVSNPPYVLPAEKELLEPQVANFEPATALFCDDIESMYTHIRSLAEKNLRPNGTLFMEIHEQYHQSLMALFSAQNWDATLHRDYQKKPRFIAAQLLSSA